MIQAWRCDVCKVLLWRFHGNNANSIPTHCAVCQSKRLVASSMVVDWYPLEINVELKILPEQRALPVVYEMHYRDNNANVVTDLAVNGVFPEMSRDFKDWLIQSITEVSREETIKVFSYAGCFSPIVTVSVQRNLKSRFDNTIEIK